MNAQAKQLNSLPQYFTLIVSFLLLLSGSIPSVAQVISGTYAIKNVQTGKLLRPQEANKQDGTPIVLYSPVNWKCVTWNFNAVAPDTYQLQNLFTHKTLQPVDAQPTANTSLEQRPLSATNARQQWEFVPATTGVYLIRLKGTELYLTSVEQVGADNSGVALAPKKKGPAQQWTLTEQHPTM